MKNINIKNIIIRALLIIIVIGLASLIYLK